MLAKTEGIIFRTTKYSESSVIAAIYTEQFGLQSYIINGVRGKSKTLKPSLIQPLAMLSMEVYKREGKNINRAKSLEPLFLFKEIPFDVVKSSLAMFIAEVLNKCVVEEEKNSALFNFLKAKIISLDEEKSVSDFHLKFLAQLTSYLGFSPHGKYSEATPVFDLMEGSFVSAAKNLHPHFVVGETARDLSELFSPSPNLFPQGRGTVARKEILTALLEYYSLHVSSFKKIKSLEVLEQVFA